MIATLVEHLSEMQMDFKELEKFLFQCSLDMFRHLMVEVLESYDKELLKVRDKERYKVKETNPRTIQTLVGEISFKRRYYRDNEENAWIHLLDEKLDLETEKSIGPGLLNLAVTWATKGPSYRDARDRLTDLYGAQILSHEAIRQALIEVGKACEREQENKIVCMDGKKSVDTIFIEVDGFMNRLQGQPKKKKRSKLKEAKMAVIHEGWTPRTSGKKSDYRIINPHYISNLEESDDFWEQVRGYLNAHYKDIDNTLVVINGDGASWIREGVDCFARSMYQYDRFHIARDIRHALRLDEDAMRKALKAFRENEVGTLLYVVTEAWVNCEDEIYKERLEELKYSLLKNEEYIVDYRKRLKQKGYKVDESWRGLGAAESNVNKFKNRTGKRGRAWSPEGLTAILMTLSRMFRGDLHESLSRTLEEREEWILDRITSGVGRIKSSSGNNYEGVRKGSFPAISNGTQGYSKLLRNFSKVQFE